MFTLDSHTGLLNEAQYCPSQNCDERDVGQIPEAIIVHCISLPPGEYGGDAVIDFFTNTLEPKQHTYFKEIAHLTVSAHFFIRRDGQIVQFVPTHLRAWHAGESFCLGKPKVNNFSIGIELEGLDTDPDGFTNEQYDTLRQLNECLKINYPAIENNNIFAHSDIAPGRKPDPGRYFDWSKIYPKTP